MKLQNFFKQIYSEQDGSVIVVVAICMAFLVGILAFSMDLGVEYIQISKLQNALDCAALAAVRQLPGVNDGSTNWVEVENTAANYMDLNGIPDTGKLKVDEVYQNNDASGNIVGVTVSMTTEIHYHFAEIFGVHNGDAARSATAKLVPVSGMSGLIPLCITEEAMGSMEAGTATTLKFGSNLDDLANGWFGIVQLDASGASVYREDFINGCQKVIKVNDILEIQTGDISGPTQQAFDNRTAGHTECTYDNHEDNCPRIATVPVVTILPGKEVQVKGFARFFLDDVTGSGNNSTVTATYIGETILPGTVTGGNAGDFGIYVAKLTN